MARAARVRAVVFGTETRPRLTVFRSNRYIVAQLINDEKGKTIAAISSKNLQKGTKQERAAHAGKLIAEQAIKAGIKKVVFDRKSYRYHGRVRAFAEGARKTGLIF